MLTRRSAIRGPGRRPAADVIWIFNDAGLYHQLVLQRGWKPAKFRDWASDSMRWQLLDPESARLP